MVIVNTTFVLSADIVDDVLRWIRDTYIASACHIGAHADRSLVTRVLQNQPADTDSYAVHVCFDTLTSAAKWNEGVGAKLRAKLGERYGERALTFNTYLEVIE